MPINRYQSVALRKAASMRMEDKDYAGAAELYRKLASTAVQRNVAVEGLDGYLKAVTLTSDMEALGRAADEVLASPYAADDLAAAAHFAKARSLDAAGQSSDALGHYRKATEARTREAAEAHYRIASILFGQGDLAGAEKEVYALSDKKLPFQYWTGKAFLLLGDIYVKKNDAFQARATYQSIVDGYADRTDGIVEEARQKIDALK